MATKLSFDIHRFAEVDSTNLQAKRLALSGAPPGTVVLAETQTQGRGQANHQWHSPQGGLYVSVLLNPAPNGLATDLCLLAGVAVAQTVRTVLPKTKDVSVKWPNDCLVGHRKVAGILAERLDGEVHANCILGIGINVNTTAVELEAFQSQPFGATSFRVEAPEGNTEIETVLEVLLRKLSGVCGMYYDEGFEPVRYLWEQNCHFVGKQIEFVTQEGKPPHTGEFLGIDSQGALMISAQGDVQRYVSGSISCIWW